MPRPWPKQPRPRPTSSLMHGQLLRGEPLRPLPQLRSLLTHDRPSPGSSQALFSEEYSLNAAVWPSRVSSTPRVAAAAATVAATLSALNAWHEVLLQMS